MYFFRVSYIPQPWLLLQPTTPPPLEQMHKCMKCTVNCCDIIHIIIDVVFDFLEKETTNANSPWFLPGFCNKLPYQQ